ncbi:branched-chain alpha-keto acid dehydrogenase E2 component [Fusarium agapanthi]|uniref:Dihydrolipoamide acetyltransferase component of pyruvate dehydrogenase complex n=1 Tax=Fusarium agapanthi TaxID=1803897 RepID=A0A9P5EAS2_9HYPO|nr:branched-chain alpha-keto acid dehydrogenase E2 component [Fusarium agapanthi]
MLRLRQNGRRLLSPKASASNTPLTFTTPTCKHVGHGPFSSKNSCDRRWFGNSTNLLASKPYLLADIGEGITECQIISWAVKPGDKVEQFDPICEVQSDKASVEITSRFEGTIEKLHHEVGDMAKVGSALLDIDVADDESSELTKSAPEKAASEKKVEEYMEEPKQSVIKPSEMIEPLAGGTSDATPQRQPIVVDDSLQMAPAVRRLLKINNIRAEDIAATGKNGRLLKDDVIKHIAAREEVPRAEHGQQVQPRASAFAEPEDFKAEFSPVQNGMFKSMTASLAIPHFLYTHTVDLSSLTKLREQFRKDPRLTSQLNDGRGSTVKLSSLPFIMKALSKAVERFPSLNAHLNAGASGSGQQPELILKGSHNFGMAVDTPNGLLVPVIRNVQNLSILSIAAEIARLGKRAKEGKLSREDMKDGSLVISNIGSIGGNVVMPVILAPMTAIIAVGKTETVPAFQTDEDGAERIVKKEQVTLSWSADHRVIDGATVAKCAQQVAMCLEKPEFLGEALR